MEHEAAEPKGRLGWTIIAGAAVGIAVGSIALGLIPPTRGKVGPAVVSVGASVGGGRTALALPPFGTVLADTHSAPLDLDLAISEVDFEELGPLATTSTGRRHLGRRVRDDLQDLLRRAALQSLGAVIIVSVVVCAAAFRRRWPEIASGAAAAAVTYLALLVLSALTYRVEAFEAPRFTGTLTRARQVVDTLQRSTEILDEARSRFEVATRRVSDLIALLAREDIDPRRNSTTILHVSDVHANPLGMEIVEELAREFDVDAVIDTGDLGSSEIDTGEISSLAEPIDRSFREMVEDVPAPYFFVPGNHDSFQLRRELARARNGIVFRNEVLDVAGLDVLGWADPTFSTQPVPQDEKDQERLTVGEEEVLPSVVANQPDLLAVHDERLALSSVGAVPLVLAGHVHERRMEEIEDTFILTVGSAGATGLKSLTVETDRDYEAEVLYFDDKELIAADYLTLSGVGGEFDLERQIFATEQG